MQVSFTRTILAIGVGIGILSACGGGDASDIVENPELSFHAREWKELAGDPAAIPTFDPNAVITGAKASGISGSFSPIDLYKHYGIPFTPGANGTGVPINSGAGATIAIVDAPGSSTIAADLALFNARFGLPSLTTCASTSAGVGSACTSSTTPYLTVIDLSCGPTKKTTAPTCAGYDPGWGGEIALDVQYAHAFAPKANIVLIMAKSASIVDLDAAVKLAAAQPNVVAVSMSYGGNEFASETFFDTTFKNGIANNGVVFLASTGDAGDWGSNKSYPAASTYVTAVGGTGIKSTGEIGWSGGGGGPAIYQKMPSYQSNYLKTATTAQLGNLPQSISANSPTKGTVSGPLRAMPDLSLNADPANSPVLVISANKLQFVGGTSESAPLWAGIVAQLASQTGVAAFKSKVKTATDGFGFNSLLYIPTKVAAGFADVTVGTNLTVGGSNACKIYCVATTGYDTVTGLGVPIVSSFLDAYK
jgi:subtilase family serine protease